MVYQRFIVCGDSYSEGMTDEIIDGQYRGWADRVADEMAKAHPDFTYVNLAVRGKLLGQVVQDQVPVALSFVTGADTLVSPFTHNLGAIPALPLLAILPTSSSKWALLAIIVVVAVGALLAVWALTSGTRSLIQALILIVVSISVLGYLASGSLMTAAMSAVGVSIWKLSLSLGLEIGLGVALMVLIPQIKLGRR